MAGADIPGVVASEVGPFVAQAEAAASAAAQPHTHVAGDVTDGVFTPARLGSGTASVATVLRGDGSWGDVPGMGDIAAALNTILNGA